MNTYQQIRAIEKTVITLIIVSLFASPAYAAGSGMPWEGPLQSILESIEGPVAQILGSGYRSPLPQRVSFCPSSRSQVEQHSDAGRRISS